MEVNLKFPVNLEERLALGDEFRMNASWDEFLDVLPDCPYRIEYDEHQIISFMGYATENHENIALKIGELLRQLLGQDSYKLFGSNLALHIPGRPHRYFNADCTVIKGNSERVVLRGNMYAVANPVLLVEVLSASTYDHDLGRKFQHYRKIPTLQQVIYIDSDSCNVINQIREAHSSAWRSQEYDKMTDAFQVLQQGRIELGAIYSGVEFLG
jgi:Uma2 family endonuclease